jgi:ribonucleoside-diphosphate reductase alpha chain
MGCLLKMSKYHGINIDLSLNSDFSEQALSLLKDYYCRTGEDPQEALARASLAYCEGDLEFAQRIYNYASKRWFMFASPVLSNAPLPNEKPKGLPISCFLTYVDDTLDSLIEHNAEVAWLSVKGGGVGGHWSSVRGISDKSPGPIPFLKVVDSQMTAYKQGKTRKGSYAAYIDVSHPDIVEFINFKVPTGGDSNRKCFNLFNAVNITDNFMEAVINDESWELRDPNTALPVDVVQARDLWERLLEARFRTGSPYLNFIDTANRSLNEFQQELGLRINGSNLCNEIHLATDENRTAVCCLSSVNLEKYDEWKDTRMVQDLVRLLDNVLQFFIENCPKELSKAQFSAFQERSIGLGAMGFHGYLQQHGIAWESLPAKWKNESMFANIKKKAVEESRKLAKEKGEPNDILGSGMRNAHLLAIAPNANSSIICGCTPSIEPLKSNAFTHRTRAGSHLVKNKYLEKLLEEKGINNDATWKTIISNKGSVQHLDSLTDDEKETYKTAFEIDQGWVVDHAADRQVHICQGQSVNLFFPAKSPRSYINSVHLRAYKKGLKGLYYLRSSSGVEADNVSVAVERVALQDAEECMACHG